MEDLVDNFDSNEDNSSSNNEILNESLNSNDNQIKIYKKEEFETQKLIFKIKVYLKIKSYAIYAIKK